MALILECICRKLPEKNAVA